MSDKKLNIALVNDTYYPNVDGVVKTVDSYARVLGKTNNVTVCVPSQGKTVDRFSYRVIRVTSLPVLRTVSLLKTQISTSDCVVS